MPSLTVKIKNLMKNMRILLAVCLISLPACSMKNKNNIQPKDGLPATTQQVKKMPSKEEMMQKWMDYATPGPEHKELNRMVGKWNYKVKMWMDPQSAPEESTGKSDIRWVMGGRYIEQNTKGKSMGQNFEGKGIIGYDRATKKFRSVWYDNMGTGLMIGSGTFNAKENTLEEAGSSSCPFKGTVTYRFNTWFKDKDHFNSEMFMENPFTGIESKNMLIEYTRAK
jgi:hypothetical protein